MTSINLHMHSLNIHITFRHISSHFIPSWADLGPIPVVGNPSLLVTQPHKDVLHLIGLVPSR